MKRLLQIKELDLSALNHTNILYTAVYQNNLDALKLILDAKPHIDIEVQDLVRNNIFHIAAGKNNLDLLQVLLPYREHYAVPIDKMIRAHDKNGNTPIDIAKAKGYQVFADQLKQWMIEHQ